MARMRPFSRSTALLPWSAPLPAVVEDEGPRIITTGASLDASRPFGSRQSLTAAGIPESELGLLGLRPEMLGSDDEIWRYYGGAAGGEVRFFITRVRNLAARVNLQPERYEPSTRKWVPDDDPERRKLIASLKGPLVSQSQLLAQAAGLFALVGHGRLLAHHSPLSGDIIGYEVMSSQELSKSGTTYTLRRAPTATAVQLDASKVSVAWLWKGGLDYSGRPESSVRVALPILRMLERLNLSLSSIAESRLVGAGILLVAREMDRKAPVDGKKTYRFADELEQVMMAALGDQGTAAARVPITIELQHQMVKDGIKFVDMAKESDKTILEYIDHYLIRLARAFSWPDEGLVPGGAVNLNHWTAWWVGEREYSDFFGPLMDDVVQGLTAGWYHPILKDNGLSIEGFRVGFDPSAIRRKAEDTEKAVTLVNAKIVSPKAGRLIAGLDPDTDGVDEDAEFDQRIEMLDLSAKFTAYGAILLPKLGYDLTDEERNALLGITPAPEPEVEPGGEQVPGPDPANTQPGSPDARKEPAPGDAHYRPPAGSGPSNNSKPGLKAVVASAAPPPNPVVLAVVAVIDAAIWAAWARAGNKVRNKRRVELTAAGFDVRTFDAVDVGRAIGPARMAQLWPDESELWDDCWDVADRQLAELLPDPTAFSRAAAMMRFVARAEFVATRPLGVRVVATDLVCSTLSGENI